MQLTRPEPVQENAFEVRPCNAPLGAEVICGDLRGISDETFARLHDAWLANLVLLIRGQNDAFDSAARRLMHRTYVKGTRPIESPEAAQRPPHPRGRVT